MYQEINFSDFVDSFSEQYKDKFSYEGKRALFDYLEEYEESTGEKIELDPIALCCEYTEYENFAEYSEQYTKATTFDEIENYTTVIKIEGTDKFIIQDF